MGRRENKPRARVTDHASPPSKAAAAADNAYLAARLHKRWWARIVVMLTALVLIVLICFSRLYLGVHYPSDVFAGVLVGLGWAAF